MGPQLTVLIIEVPLFQSVHNSKFDCKTNSQNNDEEEMMAVLYCTTNDGSTVLYYK